MGIYIYFCKLKMNKFAIVALLGSVVIASGAEHEQGVVATEKSPLEQRKADAKHFMERFSKPMPFDKHKAIFIKKYGVKKWEALCELKKMWESVHEDKEAFIKKWGGQKLKAYFRLVKMWDAIDKAWMLPAHQKKMSIQDHLNYFMQW